MPSLPSACSQLFFPHPHLSLRHHPRFTQVSVALSSLPSQTALVEVLPPAVHDVCLISQLSIPTIYVYTPPFDSTNRIKYSLQKLHWLPAASLSTSLPSCTHSSFLAFLTASAFASLYPCLASSDHVQESLVQHLLSFHSTLHSFIPPSCSFFHSVSSLSHATHFTH